MLHFSAFPPCFLVSPQLQRFTVLPSWKEGNVHALCKASHQLACSSRCRLAAVLHVLYAQGSAKHALKPCPLQLCGPSLPRSSFPFAMPVPHPPAMPSPCSSTPLWTSSPLLLLKADFPKPTLALRLRTKPLGGQGTLKAQES